MAVLMLVFVPIGRALIGTGGECAGASAAVIANEIGVVVAMLSRYESPPLDCRNVVVLTKSVAIAAVVLVVDRFLRGLGPARLGLDLALYVVLALAVRLVRFDDVRRMIDIVKARRAGTEIG
jgi:hypothetical protein